MGRSLGEEEQEWPGAQEQQGGEEGQNKNLLADNYPKSISIRIASNQVTLQNNIKPEILGFHEHCSQTEPDGEGKTGPTNEYQLFPLKRLIAHEW